jgi:hypothetical protein
MAALASALWLTIAIPIIWAAPQTKSTSTVHVREYTRKDGTVVAAHERSAPDSPSPATGSSGGRATVASLKARAPTATPTGQAATHVNPTPTKSTQPSSISPAQQGTPTIHVRQYTRKDGTVVAAHERRAPASLPSKTTRPGPVAPKAIASSTAASAASPPRSASATGTPTSRTTTNGQPVFEGTRGGEYHYSASGKKVYSKKKE